MTQERIFNKLKQHAPLLSEITLLQVPGNVTFAIEGTNNAAAKHAENDLISPAADTMLSVTLAGYEIVKVLRISKTVQAMAINAFESWLVDILGENIAAKIGETSSTAAAVPNRRALTMLQLGLIPATPLFLPAQNTRLSLNLSSWFPTSRALSSECQMADGQYRLLGRHCCGSGQQQV